MTARDDFSAGVVEVEVLRAVTARQSAGSASDLAEINAINRAAVLLLVSHFEGYLKSVAEEFVDFLNSCDISARQVPEALRELHTEGRLREILSSNDVKQRQALYSKLDSVVALWVADKKIVPGILKAEKLSRLVTNAHSETIDKLYVCMGVRTHVCDGDLDVDFGEGEVTPVNIRLALRDIVQCRNDIAHGSPERVPTPEDVERYVAILSGLADRLDRKFHSARLLLDPPAGTG